MPGNENISSANCTQDNFVLLSDNLGDHHAAILSSKMNISNSIESDCAPLNGITKKLLGNNIKIKALRDVTRGVLTTVLNGFSSASKCCILLKEENIPITDQVGDFCEILGLDPLYIGNEGKMLAIVNHVDAQKTLDIMRSCLFGENAAIIGKVIDEKAKTVLLETSIGGTRIVPELYGESLPIIC